MTWLCRLNLWHDWMHYGHPVDERRCLRCHRREQLRTYGSLDQWVPIQETPTNK